MLKSVIYKLGQNPKLSLKRFFIGLGLFVLSLIAIAYGYYRHAWVQLIGLGLLVPALCFALWGYIGIFANRFSQVIATMHPDDKSAYNDKLK
jgi:cytochrome b